MWQFPAHNQVWLEGVGLDFRFEGGIAQFSSALSEHIRLHKGWDVGFGSRGNDPSAGSPTER